MKNKDKYVIILLSIIIVILSVLCALLATKIFNQGKNLNEEGYNIQEENNQEIDDINIKILSIDNVEININAPNHKMSVAGKMEISFPESEYMAVVLYGYCIGANNEKYIMYGPGNGAVSFHNYDTEFYLVNNISSSSDDIIYQDGTTKTQSEVDWKNVIIKSCTVEKAYGYKKSDNGKEPLQVPINFEKNY